MHEHKRQLHEKIWKRQSQLQAELEQIESRGKRTARAEREVALADALATLQIHLATGWDNVGVQESAELARWLESTQYLVDGSRLEDRAQQIFDHLQSQWKLDLYGVPAQE